MAKYAVIGNPVQHSLSPTIQQSFADQTHIEFEYSKIEAPIDGFPKTLTDFYEKGGQGCNITIPFKSEAYALCNKLGDSAKLARAVNCLKFEDDGTLFGDNFDGAGLVQDLLNHQQFSLCQKKILIIGAGGAVQGILGPLLEKAPSEIIIANRTGEKAIDLAKRFKDFGPVNGISLDRLPKKQFDLIIHATALGYKNEAPKLAPELIGDSTLCYDLSYGKAAHPFLKWAKTNGCQQATDGLGMLVEQAAASFYLWNGVYPETQPILIKLKNR